MVFEDPDWSRGRFIGIIFEFIRSGVLELELDSFLSCCEGNGCCVKKGGYVSRCSR